MNIFFNEKKGTQIKLVFNETLNELETKLKENNLLGKDTGSIYYYFNPNGDSTLFLNLDSLKATLEQLRLAGHNLAKQIVGLKLGDVFIDLASLDEKAQKFLPHLVEGLFHGVYKFDKYKKENKEENFNLYLVNISESLINDVNEIQNIMVGIYLTRDLVNTPANDLYPESYKNIILKELEGLPIDIKVFNKEEIIKLNMQAGLSVSLGSDREPYFIELKYQPNKKKKDFLTLVGKGLTYDSGGYAIKSPNGMTTMKADMSGSAAVLGAIKALALNKVNQNVCGVMFLTENMINGSSYKNGDIISSMKGTSIFIGNTDAEGRVTLADSIYYAATKVNSKAIVEISTLTGACVYALGDHIIGAVTNNDKLFDSVLKAGELAGEQIHKFPVNEKLKSSLKHDLADITNTPRGAGAITAGLFLTEFAENKPFVHLDIAGPAYFDKYHYYPGGATGIGVKTFYNLAKKFK